jgi:asparagine synthetase B (glutamine-hydrolysing)
MARAAAKNKSAALNVNLLGADGCSKDRPTRPTCADDCLVFNGEMCTFRHLRAERQRGGAVFRSTSDSEVLLQALSAWGESAFGRLQSMYAFAFYRAALPLPAPSGRTSLHLPITCTGFGR